MSVTAVVGDCTTTTVVAIAATWPDDDGPVILEADRTGGSLAAWLGTPASPTLSAAVASAHDGERGSLSIETLVHRSASGIDFIAAPVRTREAERALLEATATVLPAIMRIGRPLLADLGRVRAADPVPVVATLADRIVIVHRQATASAPAAAVRLDRCAELVERIVSIGRPPIVAVIGDRPFDLDEIRSYLSGAAHADVEVALLADDPVGAAVFAGRTGVSARRLARLPLSRSARQLALALAGRHDATPAHEDVRSGSAPASDQVVR